MMAGVPRPPDKRRLRCRLRLAAPRIGGGTELCYTLGMNGKRLLPIGIQDFEKIRTGGYLYADKTADLYRLVTEGEQYFLSRPRRFGKSLLISTLKAYFDGRKDLFQGLAVGNLETEWKTSKRSGRPIPFSTSLLRVWTIPSPAPCCAA